MKAFVLDRYGKKAPLRMAELPTPELRDDEVLVQVHAAGGNLLDAKVRDGEFKLILPYRLPLVLGHDVAGVVTRVGPRVRQFQVGDEVYARPDDFRIGTFAEFVPVKETSLAHKPKNITMEEAASLPLVALTAWQALVEKAQLRKGQKLFIQAGSGGVGTFAIQLAKHLGATVATTTSATNTALVKGLGADVVVDYRTQDFEDVLRDYDVVLHSQDSKALEKSLRVLKAGGKLVSISGPPDPDFARQINAPWFLHVVMRLLSAGVRRRARARQVGFSFLFMRASGSQLREVTRLVEAGAIRPVVDRVFSFESTNDALAYVESGRAKGKVVIKVRSPPDNANPNQPPQGTTRGEWRGRQPANARRSHPCTDTIFFTGALMKIENSVALVTGANRGIGLAFARELLNRGARKVYAAARDPASITLPGIHALRLDVNRPEEVASAVAQAGDVTLLINNAGIAQPGGFLADESEDVARRIFETNFFSMLRMSKAFAPVLKGNGGGALLNVLSVASWVNGGELAAYSASKSAAWSLTNSLRNELLAQQTQVLGLHMAYVDTDLTRGFDVPKTSPEKIVHRALDGLEAGLDEVLADELTVMVKNGMTAARPSYLQPLG